MVPIGRENALKITRKINNVKETLPAVSLPFKAD